MEGRLSWQVAEDEPSDLHLVLFVRDACRLVLDGPGSPGPLTPEIPDLSDLVDASSRALVAAAWPAWWDAAVNAHRTHTRPLPDDAPIAAHQQQLRLRHAAGDGPEFASLAHVPQLQRAARGAFDPFNRWWSLPLPSADPLARHRRRPRASLGLPGVQGQLIDLHRGRHTVRTVIGRIERELGRKAVPFDLSIDILAVTGPAVVVRETHYAVLTTSTVADADTYADWLYTTLSPLA
ncbi:MAG: hypothetical protein ACRDQ5_28945 [Sciscionella sp.]